LKTKVLNGLQCVRWRRIMGKGKKNNNDKNLSECTFRNALLVVVSIMLGSLHTDTSVVSEFLS